MPYQTTQISASSAVTALLSTATTWAHNRGASPNQPMRLYVSNLSSAVSVAIKGSSDSTVAEGYWLPPLTKEVFLVYRDEDRLFCQTTAAATAVLGVLADNQ